MSERTLGSLCADDLGKTVMIDGQAGVLDELYVWIDDEVTRSVQVWLSGMMRRILPADTPCEVTP